MPYTTPHLTVAIPRETYKLLDDYSKAEGMKKTAIVNRAIKAWIEGKKKGKR